MKIRNIFIICFLILSSYQLDSYAYFSNIVLKKTPKKETNNKLESNIINYSNDIQIDITNLMNYLVSNIEENNIDSKNKIKGIEIESQVQLRKGNSFIAKGDVIARTNNAILKTKYLEYDLEKKILDLKENIRFKTGDQFLIASRIRYDLKNKKGYIINAYGSINFDKLGSLNLDNNKNKKIEFNKKDIFIKNVLFNNSTNLSIDGINLKSKEDSSPFKRLTSQSFKLDFKEIQKWRFQAERIEIDNEKWFSKELFLTTDPYNAPQIIIKNSEFVSIKKDNQIYLKSKWSTLILDNKFKIPVGPRNIKTGEEEDTLRWSLGYDQNSKDGLFIIRNADPRYLQNKKIKIKFKNEFYIQRALQGNTKSFTKKDASLYSSKITQDNKILDLFGMGAILKADIFDFNLYSDLSLNSLDFDKFNNIFTSISELSKTLYKENKKNFSKDTKLTFFGNYRENIWNGSIGEREILSAYGVKIFKTNKWSIKNINKSSLIGFSYGNYKANQKNRIEDNISRNRLNILLERNHSYPILQKEKEKSINSYHLYSPTVIQRGILLNMQKQIDIYKYSDGNFQNMITFKIGPEFTFGNFKKRFLDYTKFSIYPKFTYVEGNSPFDFDQAIDNHEIEISLNQQLIGPILLKINTDYNLDTNSSKYKELTNLRYEISWNRRAYNINIYYNDDSKTGGINFNLHNFNFDGMGSRFK